MNNIGFGGVYGGGIRILTDVVAFYYVPAGIGLEVAYYYSNDPLVGASIHVRVGVAAIGKQGEAFFALT